MVLVGRYMTSPRRLRKKPKREKEREREGEVYYLKAKEREKGRRESPLHVIKKVAKVLCMRV
jgi:hypothetical protein